MSLLKLPLKGRNGVVRMKSAPSSVVGVYINTAIWSTQNFFVYFKDCLLYPKLCIFFAFSPVYPIYNIDLHYPNWKFFSLLCKFQSHGDDKTCPNLPEFVFILHQQKVEEKKQTLNSSLKLSQQFLKHASLYFPKYVITICTFFIK